jgi:hypothetical protein
VTKRQNRPSLNTLVGKENLVGIEIGVHSRDRNRSSYRK